MFTGIIQTMGKLVALEKKKVPVLSLTADLPGKVQIGDSVAVNGACLTVVEIQDRLVRFNLSQETLANSNFNDLARGSHLNLELPLTMNDFLGGHLVSGHLDGVVRVRNIAPMPGSTKISLTYTARDWRRFLIHKGSVTLNGASLTISEVRESFFSVDIIPHTLRSTNFQYIKSGERLNIELDLIGKYIYNQQIYQSK